MVIKREVLSELEHHLLEKEMTIITGPRQVGKTYLMKLLQDKLETEKEKTLFLSLDFEDHKPLFASQHALIEYIRLQVGRGKAYIFIDEVQRKENAGLFLKGIYDMNLPYKFIVSGSGSIELKAKIHESMVGRKRMFVLEPLSFKEFVNFYTNYRYEDRLYDFFTIEKTKTQTLLEEYMAFGGYPRIVLADTRDKKRIEIEDIYKSYVEKDINGLLRLEKPDAFTNLLRLIASQIGSLVNVSELSSTIGISSKTVKLYLWYLEQTFIIQKLTPYYHNVRKEITKAPMYYFYDTGLRNYLVGLFGTGVSPVLRGHLFENIVLNIIKRLNIDFGLTSIHFWRTRDNAEVDFVLEKGLTPIPLEVKYKKIDKPEIPRPLRSFLIKYKPQNAYIVHLAQEFEVKIENTIVHLIPFYRLMERELENIK